MFRTLFESLSSANFSCTLEQFFSLSQSLTDELSKSFRDSSFALSIKFSESSSESGESLSESVEFSA